VIDQVLAHEDVPSSSVDHVAVRLTDAVVEVGDDRVPGRHDASHRREGDLPDAELPVEAVAPQV
jgi:hypothetical protein